MVLWGCVFIWICGKVKLTTNISSRSFGREFGSWDSRPEMRPCWGPGHSISEKEWRGLRLWLWLRGPGWGFLREFVVVFGDCFGGYVVFCLVI